MTWGKKHLVPLVLGLSMMGLSVPALAAENGRSWSDWVRVTPFADSHAQNRSGRSQAPKPKGDARRWANNNDYPSGALREGHAGTVALLLTVTIAGRVAACEVTRSSGHDVIDAAACKNVTRRARFTPQLDYDGQPVVGVYPLSVRFFAPSWEEIQRAYERDIILEPPFTIPAS